jgi:hypothetical protein
VAINSLLQTQLLLFQSAYKRKGFWYALKTGMTYIVTSLIGKLVAWFSSYDYEQWFLFQGKPYKYLYHNYNSTWTNPRCVEIPIISRIVQDNKGKRILEVGNVLQHYIPCSHDVLDLNEVYPNVINQDITEFKPKEKYDLVVSISTIEHIGCWEDEPKQPEKILKAIENVKKNVLAPKGKFVLTLPLGENKDMERYISEYKIKFHNVYCMKRVDSKTNAWRRSLSFKYEHKNEAVVIGMINAN